MMWILLDLLILEVIQTFLANIKKFKLNTDVLNSQRKDISVFLISSSILAAAMICLM